MNKILERLEEIRAQKDYVRVFLDDGVLLARPLCYEECDEDPESDESTTVDGYSFEIIEGYGPFLKCQYTGLEAKDILKVEQVERPDKVK